MTSIIVYNENRKDLLSLCLDSIRLHTKAGSYEIIVVDNQSSDDSAAYLRQQPDVRTIYAAEKIGFAQACNLGLQAASGKELLLLSASAIATPSWLDNLLLCLYAHSRTGAVSCLTNSCSNFQQLEVSYKLPDLEGLFSFGSSYNKSDSNKWQRMLKLSMFCFLFKREVYEKTGALDERFSSYHYDNYADDDYCIRIWQNGYECVLAKDTFIHHSTNDVLRELGIEQGMPGADSSYEQHRQLFLNKWGIGAHYPVIDATLCYYADDLPEDADVLVLDCHEGHDLFYLEALGKNLNLYGMSNNSQELAIVKSAGFHTVYCADIQRDIWQSIPRGIDVMFISNNILLDDGAAQSLLQQLNSGGRIYYMVKENNLLYGRCKQNDKNIG